MYDFRSTTGPEPNKKLSSQAMLFGGDYVENNVVGYQTLRVDGREIIDYHKVESTNIGGVDGSRTMSKNLKPRLIIVHYRLVANSNLDFQKQFRKLVEYISGQGVVEIEFNDDPEIYYFGEVVEWGSVPTDSNDVISSFTIQCDDPYKYSSLRMINQGEQVTMYSSVDTKPEQIEVTITSSVGYLVVSNGRKDIILYGNYNSGDLIIIDFENTRITKNNTNILSDIDYVQSSFHQFKLRPGDSVTSGHNHKVFYRDRWE